MKIKHAIIEVRSQHSRGSSNGRFGGPDTYIAVQIVPMGVQPLSALNHKHAKARGIVIRHFGEGYKRADMSSTRNMLGCAYDNAETFACDFNERQDREFNRLVHEGAQ